MNQSKLSLILKAIEDKKGEDIVNLNVEERSPFFSNVIIVIFFTFAAAINQGSATSARDHSFNAASL